MDTSPLDTDARARFLVIARSVDVKKELPSEIDQAAFSAAMLGFTVSPDALSVAPSVVNLSPVSEKVKALFARLFQQARRAPSDAFSGQSSTTLMLVGGLVGIVAGVMVGIAFTR